MSVTVRLAAFAVAVVVAFGAGHVVGAGVGPLDDPEPTTGHHSAPASDLDRSEQGPR